MDNAIAPGSTTNFTSEANINTGLIQKHIDIGSMFKSIETYTQQDIKEFLRKPVTLATGNFTATDSGFNQDVRPYNLLVTNPIYNQKVLGHLAIRAELHVKLVLNATRFQQGRYCLAWFPTCGGNGTTPQESVWFNMHCATLTSRTQLPHVEIDLNRDTECNMVIPFISAYSHKGLKAVNYTDPGRLLLFPYSALQAPVGSTTASYTIYCHFENVHLDAPSQPQSNVRFKKTNVQHQEQKEGGIAPISAALSKVSEASALLANIPLLSSVAQPVSWFTDIASSVAYIFGWSSPLDLSEVTRAIQTIVPYSNNVDMPDASMPLSLFARNAIETLPGLGGTDIDEMAIDHIKTIPAYFSTFNLSTSDVVGTSVYAVSCNYSNYYTSIVDNGRTLRTYTPLSYLSLFFSHARGGLVFRFKIASTEFHSGRYEICFGPYDNNISTASVTNANLAYLHREIVDLRDGCEFTFHVPYSSITNYRYLTADINENWGAIQVYPVNPLKAPDTVSSTVRVLVEVAGAPDVEFAGLRTNTFTLSSPSAPQSAVKFVRSANEVTSGDIGNAHIVDDSMLSSRHCMGERVLSLNSILKHTDVLVPLVQNTTARSARIDPFGIYTEAYIGSTQADSDFKSDLYSMIVSMFSMSRGSVRYRVFPLEPRHSESMIRNRATITYDGGNLAMTGVNFFTTPIATNRWELSVTQNQIYRGCVEVQTPPYHSTYARTNVNSCYGAFVGVPGNRSLPSSVKMALNVDTILEEGMTIKRQVADDFQCSAFISVPCVRAA